MSNIPDWKDVIDKASPELLKMLLKKAKKDNNDPEMVERIEKNLGEELK